MNHRRGLDEKRKVQQGTELRKEETKWESFTQEGGGHLKLEATELPGGKNLRREKEEYIVGHTASHLNRRRA